MEVLLVLVLNNFHLIQNVHMHKLHNSLVTLNSHCTFYGEHYTFSTSQKYVSSIF